MRKVTMMMGMLLTLGLSSACSSDDEMNVLVDSKLELFADSLNSVPENDYTGYLQYDNRSGWYISHSQPIDCVDIYYPLNLPNDLDEGKVSFSGKVIKMTDEERESLHFQLYGGHSYYFIYLTKIEEIEEYEIPYRGDPPFTITDMPGMMVDFNMGTWYISYVNEDHFMANLYCPTELSEEFMVQGLNVIISGNVYEEVDNPDSPSQKVYKIELTKIETAE